MYEDSHLEMEYEDRFHCDDDPNDHFDMIDEVYGMPEDHDGNCSSCNDPVEEDYNCYCDNEE